MNQKKYRKVVGKRDYDSIYGTEPIKMNFEKEPEELGDYDLTQYMEED